MTPKKPTALSVILDQKNLQPQPVETIKERVERLTREASEEAKATAPSYHRHPVRTCTAAEPGWECSRAGGHEGPCAASPANLSVPPQDDYAAAVIAIKMPIPMDLLQTILDCASQAHEGATVTTENGWFIISTNSIKGTTHA